jgi:Protein of unknown function DUF131.
VIELIILGIVLVFLGILLLFLSFIRPGEGKTEAGGVVIVGPVPIVFGTSQRIATAAMLLAIVLTILTILLFASTLFFIR